MVHPAQEHLAQEEEGGKGSLTRLDLSTSLLPTTSSGLAAIQAGSDGGGSEEPGAEAQPADVNDQGRQRLVSWCSSSHPNPNPSQ